jgi:hypothetical protein
MIPWMTCLPDESDVSIQKKTIIVKKVGMGVDSKVFSMTAKLGFTHN